MFRAKTEKIKVLAERYSNRIAELEQISDKATNIYIDFANVLGWQDKLGWHLSLKRLKQLLSSFDTIREIKFYSGTRTGNSESEKFIEEIKNYGYIVITKPVKVISLSIDVSSIPLNSPEILKQFIRQPLLRKLNIETIEFINKQLKELNQHGIKSIKDLKCNFDVEIGRDMLLDYHSATIDSFVLWSGDSDFADPVRQLLLDKKKVTLFCTAGKVAAELNDLRNYGLYIFEIQKIKEFICWPRELAEN